MNAQLLQAGRKGNATLQARAKLKREVRSGEVRVSELLADPWIPEWLKTMPLVELLEFVPYLTSKTYEEFLSEIPIRLTATVEKPTYRKRRLLADRLGEWEAGREKPHNGRAIPRVAGEGANRKVKARRRTRSEVIA